MFQKIEDEKSIIRETTGIELSTSAYLEMLVMMRGKKDKVRDVEWLASVQRDWEASPRTIAIHDQDERFRKADSI